MDFKGFKGVQLKHHLWVRLSWGEAGALKSFKKVKASENKRRVLREDPAITATDSELHFFLCKINNHIGHSKAANEPDPSVQSMPINDIAELPDSDFNYSARY